MARTMKDSGAGMSPEVPAELRALVDGISAMLKSQPRDAQEGIISEVRRKLGLGPDRPAPPQQGSPFPGVMNRTELATYLHCSLATISRRMESGDLEYIKDGSKVLFTEKQVRRYLAQRERKVRR